MADRSQTSQGSSAAERRGLDLSSAPDDVQAILNRIMHLEDENRRLEAELRRAREREAKWLQAFNSLEKPVTVHIENCIDADELDRAHGAVMRRFGPNDS